MAHIRRSSPPPTLTREHRHHRSPEIRSAVEKPIAGRGPRLPSILKEKCGACSGSRLISIPGWKRSGSRGESSRRAVGKRDSSEGPRRLCRAAMAGKSAKSRPQQPNGHVLPFKFAKLLDPEASWDKVRISAMERNGTISLCGAFFFLVLLWDCVFILCTFVFSRINWGTLCTGSGRFWVSCVDCCGVPSHWWAPYG